MSSVDSAPARATLRVTLHALGNVFLGMAAGLLVYYFVNDAVGNVQQRGLQDELVALGPIGAPSPDRLIPAEEPEEEPPSVWDGWVAEDVRYWARLPEDGVFARLVVEAMELDAVVVRGVTSDALKRGPGWMPYTDIPGETGNVGIAAHRTTYGAPFRRLDDLEPGDTIYLYSPYRRYTYVVAEKLVVTPDQVEVVESTEDPVLTLSACHPPYSARYRLIVHSELTDVHRIGESTATAQ